MSTRGPSVRVELEAAAAIIDAYVSRWDARAIDVDTVVRLDTDGRDQVDVVGVTLRRGVARGRLVLFDGGWADFEFDCGDEADRVLEIHCITNERLGPSVEMLLGRLTEHFDRQVVSSNY